MSRAALVRVLQEVARRNRVSDGLLYMQITRGVARREHPFPRPEPEPAIVATVRRLPPYPKRPEDWAGAAITRPDERWARCDIKSVALLPNVLARQAADIIEHAQAEAAVELASRLPEENPAPEMRFHADGRPGYINPAGRQLLAELQSAEIPAEIVTMARQASDERISVGRKWRRAKVLLPEPLGPIRTTRDSLGIVIRI